MSSFVQPLNWRDLNPLSNLKCRYEFNHSKALKNKIILKYIKKYFILLPAKGKVIKINIFPSFFVYDTRSWVLWECGMDVGSFFFFFWGWMGSKWFRKPFKDTELINFFYIKIFKSKKHSKQCTTFQIFLFEI